MKLNEIDIACSKLKFRTKIVDLSGRRIVQGSKVTNDNLGHDKQEEAY